MKIGIMQPYFFAYAGYWQLLNAVDKYVVYDDVNYIKNGWINRNNILLNGQKHLVTLPLEGASPNLLINQVRVTSRVKDKEKLLKTIEQAYRKAPFFETVFPLVKDTLMDESPLVADMLAASIRRIKAYLGLSAELLVSSEIDKDNELKNKDKVIHICRLLGGTRYINAIGGQELYDKDDFDREGIELQFLSPRLAPYRQFKNEFVPGLSIIDVLMFNSPEETRALLNDYELV